jgi:tRNA threonylcarbamoyladenosine biosynthesis protein TsaE
MKIATADAMHQLGRKVATEFKAGDLIILDGPLGAGKTVFVQGVGEHLGITEITSPTFTISRTHHSSPPLIHVDAYRLLINGAARLELDDLDLDTERESAITIIEWGADLAPALSDEYLLIRIDRTDEVREISAEGFGTRWQGFTL